tara:strand:- start:471 stop:1229 length:759 start_codon:yes stop_codon:yes gene_type:complete
MGALHEGHLSLIKEAKKLSLPVMVSIFINKRQFNDEEDFNNYPNKIEKDIKILESLYIDYLFIPENNYIYPKTGFEKISSGNLGKKFEGSSRPGHFDGVLTVVNRLFQLIEPKIAIFGMKDAQQLFLIKEMIDKKNYQIKVFEVPTVREELGLALSSRNLLLSEAGKEKARLIYKILKEARKDFLQNKDVFVFQKYNSIYSNANLKIDYLEILDLKTFSTPLDNTENYIIIIAAIVDGLRLIDNIEFKLEKL